MSNSLKNKPCCSPSILHIPTTLLPGWLNTLASGNMIIGIWHWHQHCYSTRHRHPLLLASLSYFVSASIVPGMGHCIGFSVSICQLAQLVLSRAVPLALAQALASSADLASLTHAPGITIGPGICFGICRHWYWHGHLLVSQPVVWSGNAPVTGNLPDIGPHCPWHWGR